MGGGLRRENDDDDDDDDDAAAEDDDGDCSSIVTSSSIICLSNLEKLAESTNLLKLISGVFAKPPIICTPGKYALQPSTKL